MLCNQEPLFALRLAIVERNKQAHTTLFRVQFENDFFGSIVRILNVLKTKLASIRIINRRRQIENTGHNLFEKINAFLFFVPTQDFETVQNIE